MQMRAAQWGAVADSSVATELAGRVGRDVVRSESGEGPGVTVNGSAVSLLGGDRVQLADGVLIRTSADSWRLDWQSGQELSVINRAVCLDFALALGQADAPGSMQGLLGSDTGQANDFALPDGTVLAQPLNADTIPEHFADAWRVTPSQSLLSPTPAVSSATVPIMPATVASAGSPAELSAVAAASTLGAIWTGSFGVLNP
ncbi:MAG: hypothetical protein NVSMB18_01790 [Acetobacteraceae bacterium]